MRIAQAYHGGRMFLGRARLGTVGESARRSPVEGLNEVHSAASSDVGLDVEDDPDHGQEDDYAEPSDTHEHDTLRRVSLPLIPRRI